MKIHRIRTFIAAALLAGGVTFAATQEGGKPLAAATQVSAADAQVIAQQKPSYPLQTCVVSGEALGSMGPAVDKVIDGHLVRLCCDKCVSSVEKDPKAVFAKIDEAVIRVQKPIWPASLTSCPVSGHPYGGDSGEPVDFVYGTRYVKLCCKDCKSAFAEDPAKYLATIDRALIVELKKSYALTTCPLSGEQLDDSSKDVLYGVTLVRFCCGKCVKSFEKNPDAVLAKLEEARKEKKAGAAGG